MNPQTTAADRRSSNSVQAYFYELADHLTSLLKKDEVYTAAFAGEDSDFVRFNDARIRQAGEVSQRSVGIDLIRGSRHATGEVTLSGTLEDDKARAGHLVDSLRDKLPHLPEDPHLLYATEVRNTEQHGENRLPDARETVGSILTAADGKDFVGLWASGGIYNGFANSLGQRNWFSTYTFNLDWSLYHQADKAVKTEYAGFVWKNDDYLRKLDEANRQLGVLARTARTIDPGRYRVYLSPAAVNEVLGTLAWGGFGLKAHRTKQTTLIKMVDAGAKLHPSVSILENTKDGVAPNFQGAGFIKPDEVRIIEKGEFRNCMVSPRSAKEYGVPTNGAADWEFPESVEMDKGDLPQEKILETLGTGLYINNLHYLNYSDRPNCRMTGMTRFATFWVEDGRIVAPLNVMRFDETIYRILGENLVGLTREREMILASETYFRRSTGSARVPGALVKDFAFTL